MRRVYSSPSLTEVGHLRNLLEHSGVRCVIRNEQLAGAIGEIPFLECQPELWVLDDAQAPLAETLIKAQREDAPATAPWRCTQCGESNEGQFAACWRCGAHDPQS